VPLVGKVKLAQNHVHRANTEKTAFKSVLVKIMGCATLKQVNVHVKLGGLDQNVTHLVLPGSMVKLVEKIVNVRMGELAIMWQETVFVPLVIKGHFVRNHALMEDMVFIVSTCVIVMRTTVSVVTMSQEYVNVNMDGGVRDVKASARMEDGVQTAP